MAASSNPTAILAIDASTGPCSAAVWKSGYVSAYAEHLGPEAQSARLMMLVEEVMKKSALGYRDLSAVACTVGPGSFTGIRVGLAAARGIAYAAGIPGLGFTTLDVLTHAAQKPAGGKPVLALLNAGKGEYYYQTSDGEPQLGKLEAALASVCEPLFIAGNAPEHKNAIAFPRADALAELAATRAGNARPLAPFYIRPPDAKPMAVDR